MQQLSQILQHHVTETSAHGLSRVASNRPLWLRAAWALCFCLMCLICSISLLLAVRRLLSPGRQTSVFAQELPFAFPDIFVCGVNPIAASRSLNLSQRHSAELLARLSDTPPEMQLAPENVELMTKLQSLPYQLLADALGHNWRQLLWLHRLTGDFIAGNGSSGHVTSVTEFHHRNCLSCVRVRLSAAEREFLRQPGSSLRFLLIADTFIPELPEGRHQFAVKVDNLTVKPPYWSLKDGWNLSGESGVRVYFVEPGGCFADGSTSSLISPGTYSEIRLSMVQTDYSEAGFQNECLPASRKPSVEFADPYDATRRHSCGYSYEFCYFAELAQSMQQKLNCTVWQQPLPAELGWLQSCLNRTGVTAEAFQQRVEKLRSRPELLAGLVDNAARKCSRAVPCSRKAYSASISSVAWPQRTAAVNMLRALDGFLSNGEYMQVPILRFLIDYSQRADSEASLTNLTRLMRSQLAMVRFVADQPLSDKAVVSIDYTWMNFLADAGGYLGLYLGCSLLTLAELLELLCRISAAVYGSRRRKQVKQETIVVYDSAATAGE